MEANFMKDQEINHFIQNFTLNINTKIFSIIENENTDSTKPKKSIFFVLDNINSLYDLTSQKRQRCFEGDLNLENQFINKKKIKNSMVNPLNAYMKMGKSRQNKENCL